MPASFLTSRIIYVLPNTVWGFDQPAYDLMVKFIQNENIHIALVVIDGDKFPPQLTDLQSDCGPFNMGLLEAYVKCYDARLFLITNDLEIWFVAAATKWLCQSMDKEKITATADFWIKSIKKFDFTVLCIISAKWLGINNFLK